MIALVLALGATACDPLGQPESMRLSARTSASPAGIAAGRYEAGRGGDGSILLVPSSYSPAHPAPLVVALHGAGGSAEGSVNLLSAAAEANGFLVLAPKSDGVTWDAIRGRYGPDIARIDRALAWTFARASVDPGHVILEGFSDGASYALGVGLSNGTLFSRVVAFSPGFITRNEASDAMPRVFIAHGTADPVLPFANTSTMIVPSLRAAGYAVEFVEFDGGHGVRASVLERAVEFMLH